jgi:hypothetical protein
MQAPTGAATAPAAARNAPAELAQQAVPREIIEKTNKVLAACTACESADNVNGCWTDPTTNHHYKGICGRERSGWALAVVSLKSFFFSSLSDQIMIK